MMYYIFQLTDFRQHMIEYFFRVGGYEFFSFEIYVASKSDTDILHFTVYGESF
jgi:Xaa-Pro aminopeptidase